MILKIKFIGQIIVYRINCMSFTKGFFVFSKLMKNYLRLVTRLSG